MKILSIETSCDDTGIAVLSAQGGPASDWEVLSNIVSSQIEIHKQYGGVFPAMAKREHQNNLVPVLVQALKQAKLLNPKSQLPNPKQIQNSKFKIINSIFERESELEKKLVLFFKKYKKPPVDLISVTNGPGLEPCLWTGINFAKALSYMWGIPVVPVNHIESHILVNFLENPDIKFPAIALVVSGGHTQIILMKKIGNYKILGETRDDAAGECFDKCAKILGLGYPGGPVISKIAEGIKPENSLPRPMIGTKDYDFSFSGLKTAVLYAWQKTQKENSQFFATWQKTAQVQFATEIQQAIIDVLIKKTIEAVKDFKAKSLILGGGVSANQELRKQFREAIQWLNGDEPLKFFVPKPDLSTDNGLMTAIAGFYHRSKKTAWQKLSAEANLRISE